MFLQKIKTEHAPKATAAYSPAVKLGDFMYVSAQIGINPSNQKLADGIEKQTQQAMENILELLAVKGLGSRHIVKSTIYVSDLEEYTLADKVYASYFDGTYPACSVVEVARLPQDAKIQIECFVIDTLIYEQQMQQANIDCSSCDDATEHCGCSGSCAHK